MKIEWNTLFKKRSRQTRGFPTGTVLFVGKQGAGKSLSATHYIERLKARYPKLYVYSTVKLAIADKIIKPEEVANYILDKKVEGEPCGQCDRCIRHELCIDQEEIPIAFFIDEIHTVLSNKKKAVSIEVMRAISQQRKALKTIVATVQVSVDLDISYRRQLAYQVECWHFGDLQFELWLDAETLKFDQERNKYIGKNVETRVWKRHDLAFSIYDTLEIVNSSMDIDSNLKQQYLNAPQGSAPT